MAKSRQPVIQLAKTIFESIWKLRGEHACDHDDGTFQVVIQQDMDDSLKVARIEEPPEVGGRCKAREHPKTAMLAKSIETLGEIPRRNPGI